MIPMNSTRQGFGPTPWRELMRLGQPLEMAGLFPDRSAAWANPFPAVNVWASEESAAVTSELPGVALDDLDISVVGDTLTVRGARSDAQQEQGQDRTFHRRERDYGNFVRVVQLPFRVETEEVSATLKNGILNITLPRAKADRPRKVQVKTS